MKEKQINQPQKQQTPLHPQLESDGPTIRSIQSQTYFYLYIICMNILFKK